MYIDSCAKKVVPDLMSVHESVADNMDIRSMPVGTKKFPRC